MPASQEPVCFARSCSLFSCIWCRLRRRATMYSDSPIAQAQPAMELMMVMELHDIYLRPRQRHLNKVSQVVSSKPMDQAGDGRASRGPSVAPALRIIRSCWAFACTPDVLRHSAPLADYLQDSGAAAALRIFRCPVVLASPEVVAHRK
jgi:hypothetical protein